ncbi:hypothetical protein EIMP300_02540 [Escherichia coli]|uniref:SF4 helicase domain-containing protein n=1 Tax=Escherichia coli TaxID=562 RepID=A0A8S0FI23_ECOLX|nr:hypothetical protein EIMP300_02540 [Escherichia coli]
MQPSDLIIVAARPSMGKTTFAMNLVENAAMLQDKPVLIFSLEMPSEQIMMRSLASLSRVDQTKIRTGQLDDEDWARISGTMGILLEKRNIYIDDSSGLTPTEVRSRARRIAREHGGIGLIMIDYLQLMRVPALSDNRTLEIASSRNLPLAESTGERTERAGGGAVPVEPFSGTTCRQTPGQLRPA